MLYGKHINEHIGISNEQLDELTSFTLDYLNNNETSLDKVMEVNGKEREVFTDDEKLHMIDVKNLNLLSVYIMYVSIICLIIALIVFINKKYSFSDLYLPYKKTLIRFLSFFMFICIFVLIDFDAFWTLFHKIFFAGNDLWILDLRKDILIMIVPPEFFNHLVITILFTFLIIIILAYCLLNYIWRKNND